MNKTAKKVLSLCKRTVYAIPGFLYENLIILLAFAGMLLKNILFQCYVYSSNLQIPDWTEGLKNSLPGLLLSTVTLLLFLSPCLLMKKKKSRLIYTLIFHGIFTLLMILDIGYYRNFNALPSISALSTAAAAASDGYLTLQALLEPFWFYDLLFFADHLIIAGLFIINFIRKKKKLSPLKMCTVEGLIKAAAEQSATEVKVLKSSSEKPETETAGKCDSAGQKRLRKEKTGRMGAQQQSVKAAQKNQAAENAPLRPRLLRFSAFALILGITITALPILNLFGLCADTFKQIYKPPFPQHKLMYFTPAGYHLADIFSTIDQSSKPKPDIPELPEDSDLSQILNFYKFNDEQLPDNEYAGKFRGKNLILIQVESLEMCVINESYMGMEITPNLNKLINARSSLYFPYIYDIVKSGNSCDCDLMVNTSLLPTSDIFFRTYSDRALFSMPEALRNIQYQTYYFNGCGKDSTWPYKEVYLNAFAYKDTAVDKNGNFWMLSPADFQWENGRGQIYRYTSDEATLKFTVDTLKERVKDGENFFSHTVLCTSHMPFYYGDMTKYPDLPEDERVFRPEQAELKTSKIIAYLNEIHYVDKQIGNFLESAEEAGLLDNAVVAIYGDHAGIRKYYATETTSLGKTYEDLAFLNKTKYKVVPLIIYDHSGTDQPQTLTIKGGQVDIMPTLMYLLGMPKSDYRYAMGKVLVNTNRDYVLLPNGTVIGTPGFSDPDQYNTFYRMYDTVDLLMKKDYFAYVKYHEHLKNEED